MKHPVEPELPIRDPAGESPADESVARAIRAAGKRQPLPTSTREIWVGVFGRGLEQVIQRRRQRRWRMAAAACAVMLAGLMLLWQPGTPTAPEQGSIARIVARQGEGLVLTSASGRSMSNSTSIATKDLVEGAGLPPDSYLATGADSYVALEYRGASLRLNQKTQVRLAADRLELQGGELYIDTRPEGHRWGDGPETAPIIVSAGNAEIRHRGTQFRVSFDRRRLVTSVREGAIVVRTEGRDYSAEAAPGVAREISIANTGAVRIKDRATSGDDWDWILAVSPAFRLENSSALEFLRWTASETGLRLHFDDQRTRQVAAETRLHGDIGDLDAGTALDLVMATTTLVVNRGEPGALKVSLLSDHLH